MAAGAQRTDSDPRVEANHYMKKAWENSKSMKKCQHTEDRLWPDGCVTTYGKAKGWC